MNSAASIGGNGDTGFLGQTLGLVFALPALIFLFTGRLRGRFRVTALLFVLGGLQGAIGWWMVTSGLFDRLDVSPLRLGDPSRRWRSSFWRSRCGPRCGAFVWPSQKSQAGVWRWAPFALMALIFVQVMFGALLAGSDGGKAYADWPTIGGEWIPSSAFGLEIISGSNFTEEHATQHLLHRSLGYLVALVSLLLLALVGLIRGQGEARWALGLVGLVALLQAGLGIMTVSGGFAAARSASCTRRGPAILWMTTLVAARAAWR